MYLPTQTKLKFCTHLVNRVLFELGHFDLVSEDLSVLLPANMLLSTVQSVKRFIAQDAAIVDVSVQDKVLVKPVHDGE